MGMEKWRRIRVIAEGKMNLSQVAILIHIEDRCDEVRGKVYRKVLKKRQKEKGARGSVIELQ